jgi:quaternary ammonium compound-resistance protein SugE
MAWAYLIIAGVLEIGWAIGLKSTRGLTVPLPTALTVAAMLGSFWFLALAVRTLPIGTAYAAWTGMGVVGTTLLGMMLYDEPRSFVRVACIALIVLGIVGLKLKG